MSATLLAALVAASTGQVASFSGGCCGSHIVFPGDRPLVTPPPYPAGMVDDVHRPGFNGREWSSRPVAGMTRGPYPRGWGSPGPEAYGAFGDADQLVIARLDEYIVVLDPWTRLTARSQRRLESARQFWLREQGYTGGVRTFRNDRAASPRSDAGDSIPTPRATIHLPADMPRTPGRLRVDAGEVFISVPDHARVSLPESVRRAAAE